MKQDNLLFEYLCMAFPYRVKGLRIYNKEDVVELSGILPCTVSGNPDRPFIELQFTNLDCCVIEKFKPYLRPMSSMTEEEDEKWWSFSNEQTIVEEHVMSIQYLLENHFDFMGLIPKGLAIEVTESNNPYKE